MRGCDGLRKTGRDEVEGGDGRGGGEAWRGRKRDGGGAERSRREGRRSSERSVALPRGGERRRAEDRSGRRRMRRFRLGEDGTWFSPTISDESTGMRERKQTHSGSPSPKSPAAPPDYHTNPPVPHRSLPSSSVPPTPSLPHPSLHRESPGGSRSADQSARGGSPTRGYGRAGRT